MYGKRFVMLLRITFKLDKIGVQEKMFKKITKNIYELHTIYEDYKDTGDNFNF